MATIHGLNEYEGAIIGTAAAFIVLASASVVLRIISKRLTGSPLGWDDWTSFLALAIFLVAEVLVIRSDLIGRTGVTESADDPAFDTYIVYVFIYSCFYFAVVALCLASILFLYRQLFIRRNVRWITLIMLLIVAGWATETLIIEIFGSSPSVDIPSNPTVKSWHVQYLSFWLANGIIEQVLTLAAILIPVVQIYKLHMTTKKRLSLFGVFLVSGLCFITGILRLALLYRPGGGATAINLVLGDILLNVHLGTAIMSANLPVCWPVVSHRSEIKSYISRRTRSITAERNNSHVRMDELSLPRNISAAHLREQEGQLFDPRGATTSSSAKRTGSNDTQVDGFDHASAMLEGNIMVTRTVDVRRS